MSAQDVNAIVIVGGGGSGTYAALALREQGFTGAVTVVGDEGIQPYERPELSKQTLTVDQSTPTSIATIAELDRLNIEFVADGGVSTIDRSNKRVILAGGGRTDYDRLLLAAGAAPRRLAVEGGQDAHLLRTWADAKRLQPKLTPGKKVVIVGGGFIGLEVAASARQRGCDVVVLEVHEHLMARVVPEATAALVAQRHRLEGVKILCGVTVLRIEAMNDNSYIVVTNNNVEHDADVVIAGVGALPRTAVAHAAGLKVDNGVIVNAQLQTADPNIFAAGDCCVFPHQLFDDAMLRFESWQSAREQAIVAATNMLGGNRAYNAVPVSSSDQYDLRVHVAGLMTNTRSQLVRTLSDGSEICFGLTGTKRLIGAATVSSDPSAQDTMLVAQMLIAQQAVPDLEKLADPSVDLRSLLTP
jgi:3-phenylpropionate/trans-cinnamate dioxygenase ferredoxin reductase component